MYPSSIRNLIECLKNLPGVGEKSAERMAYSIVNFDKDRLDDFINALSCIRDNIKKCPICNNITDMDKCYICRDDNRSSDTIFVVEKSKDIVLFEKMGTYNGKYHVLNGLVSPLNGVGPEDINLNSLFERIKKEEIKEVIIATSASIDGEMTSMYIKNMLEGKDVLVYRIGYGLPAGADIEYADEVTLMKALEGRKKI